jgi:N-acyl-L-homoserine lactone synthetase
VFPELLNGEAAPCSERIWEISRFASMDLEARVNGRPQQYSAANTQTIVTETLRYAAALGVEQLVSVSTVSLERLLRKMGVAVRSKSRRPTASSLVGCWIEVARSRCTTNVAVDWKRSIPVGKAHALEPARGFDLTQ